MTIRTNKKMDLYLNKLNYDFESTTFPLPEVLLNTIQAGFINKNDCITLKGVGRNLPIPVFGSPFEKSEWEYDESHFHPDWSTIGSQDDETTYLKAALECGKRLVLRLKNTFPDKHFRVAIAFNETVFDEQEVDCYGSSTVRFYQIRPEAESRMRIDSLDDYETEAVMEIEV